MYQKTENVVTDKMWETYRKTHDLYLRNQILKDYLYIATVNAKRMYGVCKNRDELEELINQSVLTLIECIEKFDPDRGVQFDSYASLRVRGAIIDYIRKQDWVPRGIRKKAIDISDATLKLQNDFGRDPTEEEVAEYLGLDVDKLRRITMQENSFSILSYEELLENNISFLEGSSSDARTPEQEVIRQELKTTLVHAIDGLGEKERLVISLYYYNGLKLKEIAMILGLTPSRVSQMHSKALSKLKKAIECYAR